MALEWWGYFCLLRRMELFPARTVFSMAAFSKSSQWRTNFPANYFHWHPTIVCFACKNNWIIDFTNISIYWISDISFDVPHNLFLSENIYISRSSDSARILRRRNNFAGPLFNVSKSIWALLTQSDVDSSRKSLLLFEGHWWDWNQPRRSTMVFACIHFSNVDAILSCLHHLFLDSLVLSKKNKG